MRLPNDIGQANLKGTDAANRSTIALWDSAKLMRNSAHTITHNCPRRLDVADRSARTQAVGWRLVVARVLVVDACRLRQNLTYGTARPILRCAAPAQ